MSDGVVSASEWRKAGQSNAVCEDEKKAAKRLRSAPQVKDIIEDLRNIGVDNSEIENFLEKVPEIIGAWEKIKDKTVKKMCEKSASLTKKTRGVLAVTQ